MDRDDEPITDADTVSLVRGIGDVDPDKTIASIPRPNSDAVAKQVLSGLQPLLSDERSLDLHVEGVLGVGGMGVVRLARQRSLEREVAIKTVRRDVEDAHQVSSLLQEARLTGQLEHPNIIPVHALGRDERDLPLLVMKRVAGVAWRDMLRDETHPAWQRVKGDRLVFHLDVLMHVCNALRYAHSRGVVHRDIKSQNVMIGDFGEVYLLDWGIAYRPGIDPPSPGITGTLCFMAPEMLLGTGPHITPRTDVFLLGATLYEVLTGQGPYGRLSLPSIVTHVMTAAKLDYPSSAPRELVAICERAMKREPDERYEDVDAFRQALSDFLQHRDSIQLVREATTRLAELRGLLEDPNADLSSHATRMHRLFTECRFGLQQALRTWPENPDAARELDATLALMADWSLRRRDVEETQAILAELRTPAPELEARLRALREALADEKERLEKLRGMEREMDRSVSRRQRVLGAVGLGLGVTLFGLTLAVLEAKGLFHLTHGMIGAVSLGIGAANGLLVWFQRQHLLRTQFNRSLMGLPFSVSTAIAAMAAVGAQLGSSVASVMGAGCVIMYCAGTITGLSTYKPFFYLSWFWLLGALGVALLPQWSIVVGSACWLLSHMSAAYFWATESGSADLDESDRIGR